LKIGGGGGKTFSLRGKGEGVQGVNNIFRKDRVNCVYTAGGQKEYNYRGARCQDPQGKEKRKGTLEISTREVVVMSSVILRGGRPGGCKDAQCAEYTVEKARLKRTDTLNAKEARS